MVGLIVRTLEIYKIFTVLAARHLAKSYADRAVVGDVSLHVRRGDVVGLIGPSGAGKTTVFGMMAGVVTPDHGEVVLDGIDVTCTALFERARRGLSYLTQEASIFKSLTVEQNILLVLETLEGSAARRGSMLTSLLAEFGLGEVRKTAGFRLSGGERRRCEIARALASDPSFILLDEPFTGLDPIAVDDIRQLVASLAQRGVGILITDHNARETLRLVDRAYIIQSGYVLAHGTPNEIVANSAVRQIYLGTDFQL